MPYLITTTPPGQPCESCPHAGDHVLDPTTGEHVEITHRAVATLDEARETVWNLLDGDPTTDQIEVTLAEAGGTVGPLPDGTVIEVERVDESRLRAAIPACNTFPVKLHVDGRDLIDAYNEAQEDPT